MNHLPLGGDAQALLFALSFHERERVCFCHLEVLVEASTLRRGNRLGITAFPQSPMPLRNKRQQSLASAADGEANSTPPAQPA